MNSLVKKKSGFVIRILSIIALVCMALRSVWFFFDDYEIINGKLVYKLTFRFPDFMDLISLLLSIVPLVLFVLYIFKCHGKLKATVLVPIIFGVLAFEILFGILFKILLGAYDGRSLALMLNLILDLIWLLGLVVCIISALKGFDKKIYVIIVISVCLLFEALPIVSVFSLWHHSYMNLSLLRYSYMKLSLSMLLRIIGYVSFYVALLLFVTNNWIPAIIAVSEKKNDSESINPEQALRALKDKLDFGMITEEEYQAQRAEIISKL